MSSESALGAALRALGWPGEPAIERHASLGSTNDRLKELARGGAPEGTIVLADIQTAGHGRHGRSWASPAGNLHLSALLRPASAVPLLPLAAGVAVAEAIEPLGVSTRLKWPNDVMVDDRKLGGILAESSSTGTALEWVVLGIGLNLSAALPEDLRDTAISLSEAGASSVDLEEMAAAVLGRVAVWYHRLTDGGPSQVVSAWRERALPWWGRRVLAFSGQGQIEGRAIGIDDEGGLVLELDGGARMTLRSGEVSCPRPAG